MVFMCVFVCFLFLFFVVVVVGFFGVFLLLLFVFVFCCPSLYQLQEHAVLGKHLSYLPGRVSY